MKQSLEDFPRILAPHFCLPRSAITLALVGFIFAGVFLPRSASGVGGTVFAWGYNNLGACDVPGDLTNAVEVACGNSFSMALRVDGTIATWGDNAWGLRDVPAEATNVVAISTRGFDCLALRRDGTLLLWGANAYGQGIPPSGATGIVAIATGSGHFLALRQDGELLAWGANNFGQCNIPSEATNVVAIAAGYTHNLVLRKDGRLVAWGENQGGSTNVPASATNILAISCGPYFNLALRNDGRVVAWGIDYGGNLAIPNSATNVVAVAAGETPEFALRDDGSVVTWGGNYYGELNVPAGLAPAFAIGAGNHHSLGLRVVGGVSLLRQPTDRVVYAGGSVLFNAPAIGQTPVSYQWRFNGTPLGGETSAVLLLPGVQAEHAGNYDVVAQNGFGAVTSQVANVTVLLAAPTVTLQPTARVASVGGSTSFSVQAKGTTPLTYQWQLNGMKLPGETNTTLVLANAEQRDGGFYRAVVTNGLGQAESEAALLEVVPVFAWGTNQSGVLDLPFGLTNVIALAAGASHNLALKADGSVIGWGDNGYFAATTLSSESNWVAIAAGANFSLGLRRDGTVRAAGDVVRAPADATNMTAIVAGPGSRYILLLRSDGALFTWDSWSTLLPFADATNIVAAAVGSTHVLALQANGRLLGWPDNYPQAVPPLWATNVIAIAAGWGFSLGLGADGRPFAWGDNSSGQTDIPSEATNIISIAANYGHALALRDDGRVIVWGNTNSGQGAVPPALRFPSAIQAGNAHDLALLGSGAPRILHQPSDQNVLAGTRTIFGAPAIGLGPITYQWLHDSTNVPGATRAYFALGDPQATDVGGYFVVISNSLGAITSRVVSVTVNPSAPIIVQQPTNQLALPGTNVTFAVSAIGDAPLSYQWQFAGTNLPNANQRTLTLTNVQIVDAGPYQVFLSNALGAATSVVARLDVFPFNSLGTPTNAGGTVSADWGDYDNDGRLDLLLGGTVRLFRNLGGGHFVEANMNFGQAAGSVAWGDFDNDGFLDALLVRWDDASIWRNQGDGAFTNLGVPLVVDSGSAASLVDFNNDGRLDILLGGRFCRNLGRNQFTNVSTVVQGVPYVSTASASSAWGDYDGDGWRDFLFRAQVGGHARFRLYRNLGNETFAEVPAGFADVGSGAAAWLDFDADGRLDVVVAGVSVDSGTRVAALYRNDGGGYFSNVTSGLPGMASAGLSVGDYDNDGQPDLFLSGTPDSGPPGRLFRGATNGLFSQVAAPFPQNRPPFAAWGDYDSDGRLDLALSAYTFSELGNWEVAVFRNDATATNTPPVPPASTAAVVGINQVRFQWSDGNDAQTPAPALTYAVRVGRNPGAGDVLSADAATNGLRRVARAGNAGPAHSLMLTNLPLGRYSWAVQTVDSAFAGSAFAAEQVFGYAAETLAPTNVTAGAATLNGLLDTNRLPALAWFEWGATTNHGNVTAIQNFPTNAATAYVNATLSGLLPDTTYYCQLVVSNVDGIHSGSEQSFTTIDLPQIVLLTATAVTASNATLNALVNPKGSPTRVSFDYGLTPSYGNSSALTNISSGRSAVVVALRISGLVGGQAYHFRAVATNDAGSANSADATFVTSTEPEAITAPATEITTTSATLNAFVRPNTLPTDVFFEHGLTPSLGTVSAATNLPGGANLVAVAMPVTNLPRSTMYYFRVAATNVSGITRGWLSFFRTTNDVIALPPSEITMTNATLKGLVNPNGLPTSAVFQYGLTTNFGSATPEIPLGGGTNLTAVAQPVLNLLAGTNYYFRVVATNAEGVRASAALSFATLPWFSPINPGLAGVSNGAAAWGDYDNDGKLDLLVTSRALTRLYRNLGNGSFDVVATPIVGVSTGSVAWNDYDNDGWLDMLVVGTTTNGASSRVYRNPGNGTFTDVGVALQPVGAGVGRWGDFNNDGRPDVLLVGETNGGQFSKIFRNDGNGAFTDQSAALPAYRDAHAVTLDYDKDGRLDILLMGRVGSGTGNVFTKLYRNLGGGAFQDSGLTLPGVRLGFGEAGDFDGDGWPDLLYGGRSASLSDVIYLYRNNGNGTFSNRTSLVPQLATDAVHWGDFDNDGRPDILARGQKTFPFTVPPNSYSAAFHNNGTNAMTLSYLPLPEIRFSAGGQCDYDGDGRLDLAITGNSRTGNQLLFYRNNWIATNTPPTPPSQQTNFVSGTAIVFGWSQGADAETPAASLSYNLRVGRTSGGGEVLSPLSGPDGFRRVVAPGNAGQTTTFTLTNLPPATYFWSVQTIDANFAGSPFGNEQIAVIKGVPVAATLSPTNVTGSAARLSGTVIANGSPTVAYFEWGATTNLDQQTETAALRADFATNQISTVLTNLAPGNAYSFRMVASNALGIAYGQSRQVQTVSPPRLTATRVSGNVLQINFAGSPGASYGIYASTNLINWILVGPASGVGSNLFQFVDSLSGNEAARFYRVSSP